MCLYKKGIKLRYHRKEEDRQWYEDGAKEHLHFVVISPATTRQTPDFSEYKYDYLPSITGATGDDPKSADTPSKATISKGT